MTAPKMTPTAATRNSKLSTLELGFLATWELKYGLSWRPVQQHRFAAPDRKWRFDFSWPAQKVAVELNGGGFGRQVICHKCHAKVMHRLKDGRWRQVRVGGGHSTVAGQDADNEKINEAIRRGWRVLRYTTKQLETRPVQIAEEVFALLHTVEQRVAEKQRGLFTE